MPGPALQLSTDRLLLRPYRTDEVHLLHRLVSDPRVFFWLDHPVDETPTRERFAKLRGLYEQGLGWWAIFEKRPGTGASGSEEFVGQVILQPLPGSDEIEIGYHLVSGKWGRGFATEAALALLNYGFETLELKRIVAIVLPTNTASLAVVARLGLCPAGDRVHAGLLHRYFEMTRDSFAAVRSDGTSSVGDRE